MPFDKRNTFIRENLLVDLPKGILYEDQYFSFKMDSSHYKTISPIYWLHSHYVPLHSYMTVAIKMKGLPQRLKNKALIASTVDGKFFYAEGGKWNGDNISVKTRSFGGYAVLLDSIAPKVTPITITNNRNMSGKWSISLKVTDDLSGLDYYRGTVDDKWILMQYDAKNDMLTYYFDEKVEKGKHVFKLTVKDGVGNTSTYEANFTR